MVFKRKSNFICFLLPFYIVLVAIVLTLLQEKTLDRNEIFLSLMVSR